MLTVDVLKGGTNNFQTNPDGFSVAQNLLVTVGLPPISSIGVTGAQKTGDFAVQGGLTGADSLKVTVKAGQMLMKATPSSETERMFAAKLSADYKCPLAANVSGSTVYDKILLYLPAAALHNPAVTGDLTELACIVSERHTAANEAVVSANAIELAEVTLASGFSSIADTVISDRRIRSISAEATPEWRPINCRLTRVSDTVVATSVDLTGKVSVGNPFRWYSAGTLRQNFIVAISSTQITISTGYVSVASDQCFKAGDELWGGEYSKSSSPVGFPGEFTLTARNKLYMIGSKKCVKGWDFSTGSGAGSVTKTVAFGITLSSIPIVTISPAGGKAGSDIATLSELGGLGANSNPMCVFQISTSQFLFETFGSPTSGSRFAMFFNAIES